MAEKQTKQLNPWSAALTRPDQREFAIMRTIDAPRTLVYQAWTDPKLLAQWWGPLGYTNTVCELDVQPAGAYRIVLRSGDGIEHPAKGNYRDVVEGETLVMVEDLSEMPDDWHDRIDPDRQQSEGRPSLLSLRTISFADDDGKTKLTITTRYESATIRNAMMKMGLAEGWAQSLDRLESLLANR